MPSKPLLPLVLAAVALTSTCSGAPPEAALDDLSSVDQLRQAFGADAGTPRLLLLLSPT